MSETIRKRIIIDADVNLHAECKKRAAMRNISLKSWVTGALVEQIRKEQKYEENFNKSFSSEEI